ncbi:hypothetical protein B4098_0954 [Heyndrickxia coagulans]|uniref:Uncharacterized protein n=1 Tax=Heyndrickxia coagulans TaxID=1398 RepID=A0A150K849_HEYCO|nr:hypothetical protein B4098_0954 [Heyndrickxia coagulans]
MFTPFVFISKNFILIITRIIAEDAETFRQNPMKIFFILE